MVEEKNLFVVDEFCRRNSLTRKQLERLWAEGRGPRKTYVFARVRITAEAERDWLESLENPDEKALKEAGETAEMLREKARRAGMAPHVKRGRQV